jgi:hypothetical protein
MNGPGTNHRNRGGTCLPVPSKWWNGAKYTPTACWLYIDSPGSSLARSEDLSLVTRQTSRTVGYESAFRKSDFSA